MERKPLSIVGRGEGYQKTAEERDREIWTISSAYFLLKGCDPAIIPDKIFQLHDREEVFEPWMTLQQRKLVLIKAREDYPEAETLPASELVAKHGHKFGSSIAWMIAYALYLGYTDIKVFGVHMQHQTEYGYQRDSFFYFMGYAEGQGAKITVPRDSGIFIGDNIYGLI